MTSTQQIQTFRRSTVATLLAASALGAWADEPSPWYLGASVGITHDSNVFRIPDGPGDSYWTTSLLGGLDQPIGRQRLYGNASIGYNKYQDQTRLDNTSYSLAAGLDWATIEQLSGNVNVSAVQSLAQYNGNSILPTTERNILNAEQFGASVSWGGAGLVSVFGTYGHSRVRFSSLQSLTSESDADTASIGAKYRLGAKTTVGAAVRLTRTDYPFGIAPPLSAVPTPINRADYRADRGDGRNLDLLMDWQYSEATGVNARLSWTRLTYDTGGRTFSGLTGALIAKYAVTAKVGVNAALSRDAGNNSSSLTYLNLATGQQTTNVNESNQTTDALDLGATYAATAKIGVNAGLQYRRASFDGSSANEHYRAGRLGATYAIARGWQLGCNVSHESRSASAYSYDANVVGCSAQFTLR